MDMAARQRQTYEALLRLDDALSDSSGCASAIDKAPKVVNGSPATTVARSFFNPTLERLEDVSPHPARAYARRLERIVRDCWSSASR
jgi:hypothetical protein